MNQMSPTVPLVKVAMPPRQALMPALEEVLYGGVIAEGEYVYRFEAEFAAHFGLSSALGMSSGTAALHVAFLLAGVGPGAEVISTSMTAEPTNTAILQAGGTPIFADVDPLTGNLDPKSVVELITDRTRAICVVHYAGYPANLDEMRKIADKHGVFLVEDCAHALGAKYHDRPIGCIGDAAIFSFQAIKHMTTIDGGVLSLKDGSLLAEARRLRWFGMTKGVPRTEVDITRAGFKYNMTNVAAVIGLQQLLQIDSLLARHIDNGRYYDRSFTEIPGLQPAKIIDGAEPSYWLYTLLSDDSSDVERRLSSIGVVASKLHRPNHLHTIFRGGAGELPGVDEFYRRLVHVPCGWWVSPDDRERIVSALAKG